MIVKEASYEVSDPTVDSQVVALQGSGADTLIMVATPKPAAQAVRKAYDNGWMPNVTCLAARLRLIATLKPAGLDKSKGVITAVYGKDPTDPRWKDDPGYKEFAAFVTKYMSAAQLSDPAVVYGFAAATLMTHVLKQCGDDLSRENILRQATNIKDFELPMGLPGTKSQHLARELLPHSPDATFTVQWRELGTVWRPDE